MIHICIVDRQAAFYMLWSVIVVREINHPGQDPRAKVLYYKYDKDNPKWTRNVHDNVIFLDIVKVHKSYNTEEEFIADNFEELL